MKHIIIVFVISMSLQTVTAQVPDQMPVYPGCEKAEAKMPCFKEKLLNFIAENFNSDLLQKIKGQSEVQMMVSFVIDTNGKPVQVKISSAYEFLNNEMQKVINRLPQLVPAYSQGIAIRMQYELPVVFEVEESTN